MDTEIEQLTKILKESNNIVFFGGAGVSTLTQCTFRIFLI